MKTRATAKIKGFSQRDQMWISAPRTAMVKTTSKQNKKYKQGLKNQMNFHDIFIKKNEKNHKDTSLYCI